MLIVLQPRINRALAARGVRKREHAGPVASAGVFLTGVYGGYFGAAQGIMLLAILGLSLNEDLQRINALKVVLAGLVNLVAGIVFVVAAHVAWDVAALIAVGLGDRGLLRRPRGPAPARLGAAGADRGRRDRRDHPSWVTQCSVSDHKASERSRTSASGRWRPVLCR